ncbi:hypothetical protein C0581_03195 [Candidatus Parcubacteria bacterium]|nr:MAG: hypothetical protein C0581_03195 [Candidatus Parcubacteria bacterium]
MLGIRVEKVAGLHTGRIEGHCGVLGPRFLTREEGRSMVEYAQNATRGFGRTHDLPLLMAQINKTSLPEDEAQLFDKLNRFEPMGGCTVQVTCAKILGRPYVGVAMVRGQADLLANNTLVYSLNQAIDLLALWIDEHLVSVSEAIILLQRLRSLGMGLNFSCELLREMRVDREADFMRWAFSLRMGADTTDPSGLIDQLMLRRRLFTQATGREFQGL